jgi:hypothetical protein
MESTGHRMLSTGGLRPVIAPILRRQGLSLVLGLAGGAQVVATLLNTPAVSCPVMEIVHVPCPGCGLSRACAAMIRGDWLLAIRMHAFAPLFLAAIVLLILSGCLPTWARLQLATTMGRFERNTALPSLLLVVLVLYWLARLLYAPSAFLRLVAT